MLKSCANFGSNYQKHSTKWGGANILRQIGEVEAEIERRS